jgi:aminoglycoside phosphotransferase family enzyme
VLNEVAFLCMDLDAFDRKDFVHVRLSNTMISSFPQCE